MYALAPEKPFRARARGRVRSRAAAQASRCRHASKTAPEKNLIFSRWYPRVRYAPAQSAPCANALFIAARATRLVKYMFNHVLSGGRSAFQKGVRGFASLVSDLATGNFQLAEPEVWGRTGSGERFRADGVFVHAEDGRTMMGGAVVVCEAKCGPTSEMSTRQVRVYDAISKNDFYLEGPKAASVAAQAGLTVNASGQLHIPAEIAAYTYRPSGQIATAQLPNDYALTYIYDAAQRLIGASDNRGNQITYTLDAMGNRISETIKDASNQIALSSQRVINSLNRIEAIKGGTNPAAQTTALQYDANGNPTRTTDPLGNATQTYLDALRRLIATVLPDGAQADSYYNQLNQLTQAIDPKGIST